MSAFLHGLGDQLRLLARLRRHRLMLLLFLGASVLSVLTYRRSAMRELPVAVVDADGTALSRTVVRFLDATPELRVVTDPPPTLARAEAALTRGELTAVVLVPDGFTAALKRGRRAEVLVAADLSNVLTGKTAQRAVARVLATVAAGAEVTLSEKLGAPPSAALARVAPISLTESFAGNPGAAYAPYVAPAFALFFVHVLTLFLAWTVFWPAAPERPALERLGRLGACAAVALAAALVAVYGIVALDGLSPAASPPVVVAALLALVAVDVLFAAALRALFRGGLLGFQATVLVGMLSLMLSGLTWPWDAIPGPLRALALAIPFTPFGRMVRPLFAAPVGLADLAGPLGGMALQAGLYLAVMLVAAVAERRFGSARSGAGEGGECAGPGEGPGGGSSAPQTGSPGWLGSFRAGLRQELRLVFGGRTRRQKSGILTVLVAIPMLYPALVAYLYHGEDARQRPALLLDLDRSALSRRLILDLEATPEIRIAGRPVDLEDGLSALRRGEAELLIVIPADLTRSVKRGERAQLAVWGDGGNVYTWSIALPAAAAVVGTVDAELAARRLLAAGLPVQAARQRAAPIVTGDRRLFHPAAGYGRYLAVGVLLIVIQQLVMVSLAFSAGVRRERGLPVGAAPHPLAHLGGMAAAHAPFWAGGLLFVACVLLPVMGWSGPSVAATALLFALLAAALAPVAVGVASLIPDRVSAFQVLMFFSVPLFVASGFTWPGAQLARPLELLTFAFPATPALRALRILSMKTGDLRAVAPELLWLTGQAVAYAGLAALVVLRPWRKLRVPAAAPAVPEIQP